MKTCRTVLGIVAVLAVGQTGLAAPKAHFGLEQAERQALATSPRLKASASEAEAAEYRASSAQANRWPKLAIEATGRYVTVVPELAIPGRPQIPFTDNHSYSVGPSVSWLVWDTGAARNTWNSARAQQKAREAELQLTRDELLLATRLAYFRVQAAIEQLQLVADSLKVAETQYADARNRVRAGAASRLDELSTNREVLSYRLHFKQTQSELATALRELFALTGLGAGTDPRRPVDESTLRKVGDSPVMSDAAPTLIVSLDSIARSEASLEKSNQLEPLRHPRVRVQEHLAQANERAAAAASAQHFPKLQLGARTSLDYPNGPVLDQISQNSVSLLASWSIFEFGRVKSEVAEKRAQAEAATHRLDQAKTELIRDWQKSRDRLDALRAQQSIHERTVAEAREIAKLVYASYRAGRINILEVETANLRVLTARVGEARNKVQILMELATLDSLASKGN